MQGRAPHACTNMALSVAAAVGWQPGGLRQGGKRAVGSGGAMLAASPLPSKVVVVVHTPLAWSRSNTLMLPLAAPAATTSSWLSNVTLSTGLWWPGRLCVVGAWW